MSRPQSPVISEEPLLEPGQLTDLVDNQVEEEEEDDVTATATVVTSTPLYPIIYYHYYPSNTHRYAY